MHANLLSSLLLVLMAYTTLSNPVPYLTEDNVGSTFLGQNIHPINLVGSQLPTFDYVDTADLLDHVFTSPEEDKPAAKLIITYENSANEFKTVFHSVPAKVAN
ncbi:hypothetical protein ACLKA7_016634 [Drosophila subpalustris]